MVSGLAVCSEGGKQAPEAPRLPPPSDPRYDAAMIRPVVPLALVILAAPARADGPAWKFDKDQPPLTYLVRLQHAEGKADVVLLELTLKVALKEAAEGGATFEISWPTAKVTRTVAGKKHVYDAAKPGAASPASACFADLAGKSATAVVSSGGELKSLEGLARPSPGDFTAEGASRDRMLGEALLGEVIVKLFRLPGASSYACGVVCPLGNAVGGCHLVEQTKMTQEMAAKVPVGGFNRAWTSTLTSDGGSISAGGATLALKGGQAGTGKGAGVYGPGALVSLDDAVQYQMPTAAQPVAIRRALKIAAK